MRYLSVNGKGRLITCKDTGTCDSPSIDPPGGMLLRRLNWRELQLVD